MRTKLIAIAIAVLMCGNIFAKNTVQKVETVNGTVDVSEDVDYTITGSTPFSEMGSVNIVNKEHAVVIIEKFRPSDVIEQLMGHIYIDGQPAKNGTNCQVKMYNRGAIIMPYASNIKPLTCYTEPNFGGESVNSYGTGNSGGFMNSLTTNTLNNRIRSFKLKRGYMVTFAVGKSGWGYSRCFIADDADLEIANLPHVMDAKISSYRVFQWYDASEVGVHHTGKEANKALRTTSCFDWGQGNASLLPDVEWVPNHIYEDWPSASTCGSVTGSCHMKTNNEPGNSSDDHPQDVATVLDNWQNLMRTGMRLCSESSHDGSMNHLKAFIDSIDARGWRCDILDLHCYWNAGTFNSLTWYSDEYGKGRPIWISEWVWGSSWGNNGAFASGNRSDDATYNGTVPILNVLHNNKRVERHFYWNSEQWYTQIYRDNQLTKLGNYFANMDTRLAYSKGDYIPKVVLYGPGRLTATYKEQLGVKKATLTWQDANGDMLDSVYIQRKSPSSSSWENIIKVDLKDIEGKTGVSYSVEDILADEAAGTSAEKGIYSYRVANFSSEKFKNNSNTVVYGNVETISIAGAENVGLLQYGQIDYADFDERTVNIAACDDPISIVCPPSATGATAAAGNYGVGGQLTAQPKTGKTFKWKPIPWYKESGATTTETPKNERADFIVLPHGNYQIGDDFFIETGDSLRIKDDVVEVKFRTPWPVGETPVVLVQQAYTSVKYGTATNVFDVTNEGFKVVLKRQAYLTTTATNQYFSYIAISRGQKDLGMGKMITAGTLTDKNGEELTTAILTVNSAITATFEGRTLKDAYILIGSLGNNFTICADMVRISSRKSDGTQITLRRSFDQTKTSVSQNEIYDPAQSNQVSYIAISNDGDADANPEPTIVDANATGINSVSANAAGHQSIYNLNGIQVNNISKPGIYIIDNGNTTKKVIIK